MAAAHERRAALVTKLERLVDTQQELARLIELTRRELSVLDDVLAQQERALTLAEREQRVLQEAESLRRADSRAEKGDQEAVEQLLSYLQRHFWASAGPGTGKTALLLSSLLRSEQARPSIADAARLALEALGRPAHLSEIADLMAVETGRRAASGSLMAALSRDDRFVRADIRGYWALADWPKERRRVPEEVITRVRLQEELAQERRRQQDLRLSSEQLQRALSQAQAEEPPLTAYDPDDLQVQLEKVQDLLRASEARAAQLQAKLDDVERALAGLNQDTESGSSAHGRLNRSGRNPDRSRSRPRPRGVGLT
jgi:hypothetical protein